VLLPLERHPPRRGKHVVRKKSKKGKKIRRLLREIGEYSARKNGRIIDGSLEVKQSQKGRKGKVEGNSLQRSKRYGN